MTRIANRDSRSQRGSVMIEFLVLLGVLVLPFSCFLVATAWPERLNAAHAAAYEAARADVEAPDPDTGEALGLQRAREVMANHGFDPDDITVTFTQGERGEALTASVHVRLPALRFPGVGTWDALTYTETHTERVPDYRGFG